MGQPHGVRKVLAAGGQQDGAVTPVIGAILILVISVLGIAGVLFWGAPMIERIQTQNAHVAMVGEFEDLRDSSRELSVPDHSRFPTVVMGRGDLNLERGSRILVTINYANCDFRVTDWADSDNSVTIGLSTCGGTTTRTYSVSGGTLVETTFVGNGAIRDWMWRREGAACTGPATQTSNTCAEAWLISTDDVNWALASGAGEREIHLDMGAIFSNIEGTIFLEKRAAISDAAFGATYYGLWLRALEASSLNGVSGEGSYQVYLSLVGNHVRNDSTGVYRIRYDFAGDLSEAWCKSLDPLRNDDVTGAAYTSQVSGCGAIPGVAPGVRSVCYARVASGSDACSAVPTATFAFKFLHARIYTSLVA